MSDPAHRLLFDKIWDAHRVTALGGGYDLIYIDRHMMHELASNIAFDRIAESGFEVRRPDLCFATHDHVISTAEDRHDDSWPESASYIHALRKNTRDHGIKLFDYQGSDQGIVHVLAPEQGIALPGTTIVCGDSHTCTLGALGALSWGIGTSEVAHVLATQTLLQRRPKVMRIHCQGQLRAGVSAKDLILALIGRFGANAGEGYAVEYCGEAVRALSIEARLTLCNLSIEMGARMGHVAPDDTTYEYLANRPHAPTGAAWEKALSAWRLLPGDVEATAHVEHQFDVSGLNPQVTWGTSPAQVIDIAGRIPNPDDVPDTAEKQGMRKALDYMGLEPGQTLSGTPIDAVFIGSCTNSRLSDLQAAADVVRGKHVARDVKALVVPGSTRVKQAAESAGLDKVFKAAGFQWRAAGCSMCVAMNDDRLEAGQRCVSTSNRNFESRQGKGARTHLASPAVAAASAIQGEITDPTVSF